MSYRHGYPFHRGFYRRIRLVKEGLFHLYVTQRLLRLKEQNKIAPDMPMRKSPPRTNYCEDESSTDRRQYAPFLYGDEKFAATAVKCAGCE